MANPSVLHDDGIKTGTVASTAIQPTTAPTAGNLAVLNLTQTGVSSAETITDTAGNTWAKTAGAANNADNVASQWWAVLTSVAGSPYKYNLSGMAVVATPWGANFQEIINYNTGTPIDGTPAATSYANASAGTFSIAVGTASVAGDLAICVNAYNSAETTTPTAPLTTISTSNTLASPMWVGTGTIAGTGATTLAGTFSVASKRATAGLLVMAPSGSGVTVALTGQSATFTPGAVVPSRTVALTGKAITSATGTMSPSSSVGLVGASITSATGTVVPGLSLALLGQSGTFTSGLLVPSTSVALTGQSATFTAGTITASTGGDLTLALTGQAATFASGTLTPASSVSLNGQAIVGSTGVMAPNIAPALTGSALSFTAGALSPAIGLPLLGQQGLFSTGNMAVPGDVTVALTGQSATFTAGQITASGPQTGQTPAGRRRIPTIYFVTIDGQRFECASLAEALELLEKAKQLALQRAEAQAEEAAAEQALTEAPVPVPKFEPPKIVVNSRDLRAAVSQTKREIEVIYEKALVNAEIRMLMELSKRQSDNDDALMLLM